MSKESPAATAEIPVRAIPNPPADAPAPRKEPARVVHPTPTAPLVSRPAGEHQALTVVHREPVRIDEYFVAQGSHLRQVTHPNGAIGMVEEPWTALHMRQRKAYIGEDGRATLADGSRVLEYGPGQAGCYGIPDLMHDQ